MSLIGNYSVLNKSHAFFTNGTATAGAYAANTKSNRTNPSVLVARRTNMDSKASHPNGYNLGEAYVGSVKTGGLTSYTRINGQGTLTAELLKVLLLDSTLSGTGDITQAALSVLTQGESTIAGLGTLTADLIAVSSLEAELSGDASISEASLSAYVPMESELSGSGGLSVNLTGLGRLEASITPNTELSPTTLAEAVFSREVETGYDLESALRLILSAVAGKVSGGGTSTITIRSVTDGTNRIVATVDSNGNRTAVTHDIGDE